MPTALHLLDELLGRLLIGKAQLQGFSLTGRGARHDPRRRELDLLGGNGDGLACLCMFAKSGLGLTGMIRDNAQIRIKKVELPGNLVDEARVAVVMRVAIDIPKAFVDRFRLLRSHVRHDGHFMVPFFVNASRISGRGFMDAYESIPLGAREEFRQSFVEYRSQVRRIYPGFWAELHRPLIDVRHLFQLGHEIRIVSGKDSGSISTILQLLGQWLPDSFIHGRMTSKVDVLTQIKEEALSRGIGMIFVDDNIENIIEAKQLGISCYWPDWGYKNSEHIAMAAAHEIFPITTENFFQFLSRK
ncbi:HAD family hydrolase [Serratia nevei]|uniref:HAD family hydrolase n=1 Tax=Serratia nevei TaxID=2703794 RepID=UPI00209D49C5|nr:HAD family hydrolase [Serratia nevei]MCP1107755.1 HAD family hydrolase [Serratia nevei]